MGGYFYICCRRGCPRRSLDAGRIYNYLKLNGWNDTKRFTEADLIIVYTCGGFQLTEERSLRTVKMMKTRKKNGAKLVVTGCLTKINPKALSSISDVPILEPQELHALDDRIQAKIPYETVPDANIVPDVQDLIGEDRLSLAVRKLLGIFQLNRDFLKCSLRLAKRKITGRRKVQPAFLDGIYHLKVAHGCLGKCTYCAIRLATGKLKSKPIAKVLEEFDNGLAKGFTRFALMAEDTGSYGLDLGTNIVDLLTEIFDRKDNFSMIIKDFNVNWMIKYYERLLPLIIENSKKIEDIRMPIQSGSDRILKSMRRPYRIDNVKKVISDLNAKVPDLKIHSHMLVGFPGETASDFEQSRQVLHELDFDDVCVYCYEDRPGTEAHLMPHKIPSDIKLKRAFALTSLILEKESM